jgi:hypothetical protein
MRIAGLMFTSLALLVACSDDEDENIARQRAHWAERAPDQYVIAGCGTGFTRSCSREVVVSGRVVAAEVAFNMGEAWMPLDDVSTWTDRATAMFDDADAHSGTLRRLQFDAEWGFISEYFVDGNEEAWGARVTCFLPDRVDLQSCGGPGGAALNE